MLQGGFLRIRMCWSAKMVLMRPMSINLKNKAFPRNTSPGASKWGIWLHVPPVWAPPGSQWRQRSCRGTWHGNRSCSPTVWGHTVKEKSLTRHFHSSENCQRKFPLFCVSVLQELRTIIVLRMPFCGIFKNLLQGRYFSRIRGTTSDGSVWWLVKT